MIEILIFLPPTHTEKEQPVIFGVRIMAKPRDILHGALWVGISRDLQRIDLVQFLFWVPQCGYKSMLYEARFFFLYLHYDLSDDHLVCHTILFSSIMEITRRVFYVVYVYFSNHPTEVKLKLPKITKIFCLGKNK